MPMHIEPRRIWCKTKTYPRTIKIINQSLRIRSTFLH
nr:MAG TPA: hypothetical protein [Caudoviricetes sp.]